LLRKDCCANIPSGKIPTEYSPSGKKSYTFSFGFLKYTKKIHNITTKGEDHNQSNTTTKDK
jgi:hypothetical protein